MKEKTEGSSLIFLPHAANGKPQHLGSEKAGCPFCDYAEEENILRTAPNLFWIRNKYQTLQDTVQTLVIEHPDHNKDISTYTKAENRALFHFAFDCWSKMMSDPRFESVLFYKNHGPFSGGSLKHPHMQIVGLDKLDGEAHIHEENFEGIEVFSDEKTMITFSTKPIMGFLEINLLVGAKAPDAIDTLADYVQKTVDYVLHTYHHGRCDSYNLFLFKKGDQYIVKLTPRFIVSPYFVGYRLSQNFSEEHLLALREEFRKRLFE